MIKTHQDPVYNIFHKSVRWHRHVTVICYILRPMVRMQMWDACILFKCLDAIPGFTWFQLHINMNPERQQAQLVESVIQVDDLDWVSGFPPHPTPPTAGPERVTHRAATPKTNNSGARSVEQCIKMPPVMPAVHEYQFKSRLLHFGASSPLMG